MLFARFFSALFLCTLMSFSVSSVSAQSASPLYHQVSLSAEANRDIDHDLMRVTLYSQEQGKVPQELARITSTRLNKAIARAREVKGIHIQSGNRQTSPVHEKNSEKILKWKEYAELHLESKDLTALATLMGELLDNGLKVRGRSFSISREAQKANEDSLTIEAIAAFRARAQLVTEALGSKRWKLVRLGIQGNHQVRPYAPVYVKAQHDMLASSSMDSVEQSIEAGSSTLSILAEGVIEIFD